MGWVVKELLEHSEYVFGRTRERLAGLTDDEWAWEPVPWCWSVRPAGSGWQADGTRFPIEVPPMSTISWRLDHLIENYGGERNATWLGLPSRPLPATTGSAVDELERLDDAARWWHDVLRQVDDDTLPSKLGAVGGEWAESTRLAFVLHNIDEMIHHAAELGLLRDLYRAQRATEPALDTVATAAANGRWDRVVELAEAGANVNGGGFTALHLAVAAGATHAVRTLLARGADTSVEDPEFHATALGWAQFFGNDELVALLT